MFPASEYSQEKINRSIKNYVWLREQLRSLPVGGLKESADFRELLRLQGYLVRVLVDSPEHTGLSEHTGLVQKVREIIRPSDRELREYPLYSMLASERDICTSNYLSVRQK